MAGKTTQATPLSNYSRDGWIGVDLDGTLAHYDKWRGPGHIGEPIEPMMERVRQWIQEGREVRIFTARASDPDQVPMVREWLHKHGLFGLEITNEKDFRMRVLYDDNCVQVEKNTGRLVATEPVPERLR